VSDEPNRSTPGSAPDDAGTPATPPPRRHRKVPAPITTSLIAELEAEHRILVERIAALEEDNAKLREALAKAEGRAR
jgi:hypothetical protein